MSKSGQTTDEAEFAPEYQNSRDLSAFETDAEPVEFAAMSPSQSGFQMTRLLSYVPWRSRPA
jgi:hypothetical protein